MRQMLFHGSMRTLAALLMLGIAGVSHSATVTFSNIVDGNNSPLLFDVNTTAPDASDGNTLLIGLNNFAADGTNPASLSVVDTLSMVITAPAGYYITSVSYTESGYGQTTEGVATASGSIVSDNVPTNFLTQLFQPNAASGWSISPAPSIIGNKESISVSITNSLFAYAFTPNDTAFIEKTEASLTVGIAPIPVPAAVWLFGSGLLGVIAVARRKNTTY